MSLLLTVNGNTLCSIDEQMNIRTNNKDKQNDFLASHYVIIASYRDKEYEKSGPFI